MAECSSFPPHPEVLALGAPTPRAIGVAAEDGKVRDLVAEFMDQKRRDAEAARKAASRRRRKWPKVAFGLAAVAAWFIPIPNQVPAADQGEMTAAGMRLELYMAAQRVRGYRVEHRRLPASLSAAGVAGDWIAMRALSDSTFELTGTSGVTTLRYASTMSDTAFFGGSRRVLGRGGL